MNNGKNKSNIRMPFIKAQKLTLTVLTVCCLGSMGYYYIKKENIVSVSQMLDIITSPVQNGINNVGEMLFNADQEHLKLEEAYDRIQELESLNSQLNEKMVSYDQKIYEYQDMKKLLDLKSQYADYNTIGASVIFADTGGNWFSKFTIDRGSNDGIELNMNVIADKGLVGYISDISANSSVVTTILNDNTNVSAMQMSTGDACVVMGDLPYVQENGLLHIGYMDKDFNISQDRVIVTSKISDKYLPGIVVGYAQDITVDSNGLTASGYLKPAVDFKHISNVLVITDLKETAE